MKISRHLTALHRKGYSIRACLMVLAAVILIPVLIFGWWLVTQLGSLERAKIEREAEREAREVTATLDREIDNAKSLLTTLASSHYLYVGDIKAFYDQAKNVTDRLGVHAVLRDVTVGSQLLNTAAPWSHPEAREPPQAILKAMREAHRSKQIVISDVFLAPKMKAHYVSVGAFIELNGAPTHYLSIGIPTRKFANILQVTQFPNLWVVSIVDRNNIIVTRSTRHEEYTGTRIYNASATDLMTEVTAQRPSRDGTVIRWTRHRSDVTGWFTTVGVPLVALHAPLKTATAAYGAISGALLMFSLLLTYYLGGRLAQSIGALGIDRNPTREEFQVLFESAPNGVMVVDDKHILVLANQRMERKFGYSRDEMIGRCVADFIPQWLPDKKELLSDQAPQHSNGSTDNFARELTGVRKDASGFPIDVSVSPIVTSEGRFVIATVTDITIRRQAAERLSLALVERNDLRRRVMRAQEEERLRLAHELHDQTGQIVTAALLELKQLETLVADYGRERLQIVRRRLEQMGKALHRIAWELRPASIDELGLTSALANYVSEWSVQSRIEADFHCRDTNLDGVPPEILTIVYRVTQEGLTNIAKHAVGATAVSVVIDRSGDLLRLIIEDDGHGFDASSQPVRADGGLGLAGMRERLALIGGELEIESSLAAGTTIFARIPLDRRADVA